MNELTQLGVGNGVDGLLLVQVGRRAVTPPIQHLVGILVVDVLQAGLHKQR